MKNDPIIAATDVEQTSEWYQKVFGCKSIHGGDEFDVLVTQEGEVLLCLHKWSIHDHPTMQNPEVTPGNGLILYIRAKNFDEIRENLRTMDYAVEREVEVSQNSMKREFHLRDPNGYYLMISEFHNYKG